MPKINTLELMPLHGFRDGNEILGKLVLFLNVRVVKLYIHGFINGINIVYLRDYLPSIEHLHINGEEVSVYSPLNENVFLKGLIHHE